MGGMRANMVRDGGNAFKGTVVGNYADGKWASDNRCSNLCGRPHLQREHNRLTQRRHPFRRCGTSTPNWRTDRRARQGVVQLHVPPLGVKKHVADSYYDSNPRPSSTWPTIARPGVDDGHIVSNAGRRSSLTSKRQDPVYHDNR